MLTCDKDGKLLLIISKLELWIPNLRVWNYMADTLISPAFSLKKSLLREHTCLLFLLLVHRQPSGQTDVLFLILIHLLYCLKHPVHVVVA